MPLTNDVTSDSSQRLSRGGPVERQDAVYHAFWQLINDLLEVRGATAK
jgi:hypothetical protein